ncbi:hypothetical protein JCM33374_g6372 [Metschnikowia sp. JCM 33374]|nr:hypothetical protein JCM33374_g6372 [Metschnikowia sp. JCM 33374]
MSKVTPKGFSSAGLDTAVIEELRTSSTIGVYEDLTPIVSFIQKNGLTRSLSNMLYFSATNDLAQLNKTAHQLSVVLDIINYVLGDKSPSANLSVKLSLLEEASHISEAYSMLCSNLKIAYKIYGMRKPSVAVAMSKILQCLVDYNNSNLITQLIDNFDFNQTAVHNILVPTRDDFDKKILDDKCMRTAFLHFWISLCSASNPTTRKALLTNFKIMNNFWKYLDMDKFEVLNSILHFIDRSVCSEPTFKRATKCRILNENFLFNIRSLFPLVKSENDRQNDNEDINDFNEFKLNFIKFMNTLVSDSNKGITYPVNEFGSPLVVNNITFNINNKLIYTLLTAMKPWDSFTQLQFVMQILNHNHELLPPYMNWIVSNSGGYHDPTLSSYWIGHTLLYSEILKSPHLPVKADFVSLLPLSKSALTECISFPSDMVKQLGLQTILLQLQKLSKAKAVTQSIKDFVLSNLPSHASFLPLLTHQNKLIKLTATSIVTLQEELAPKSSSSATVGVISNELNLLNLGPEKCDSFGLILLDMYLSIQSNNELKWWNKVSKDNSFFTSLLKFSNLPFLRKKILRILQKLTKPTLVFNEKTTVDSPLLVLIEATSSIGDLASVDKLWTCIDETISRTVTSPYKYLDKSHTIYDDMSIFLVALLEQINFVPDLKNERSILEWLEKVTTGMLVIGEPFSGLSKAVQDANIPIRFKLDNIIAQENITSKIDFAKAVFALNHVIEANKPTSQIFSLMTNLGKFLMSADISDSSLVTFVVSPEKWKFLSRLGNESISDNEILAACLYCELIGQLNINMSNTDMCDFIFKIASIELSRRNQTVLKRFVWIMSDSQLKDLSKSQTNELIVLGACETLIQRNVTFQPDLSKLMKINSSEVHRILSHIQPSVDQIDLILQNPKFFYILERGSPEMAHCLLNANNLSDSLLYQIAPFYPEVAAKYKSRIVELGLSMEDWNKSLKIFTAHLSFFDQEKIIDLIFSRSESRSKQAMSPIFVDLMNALVTVQPAVLSDIKSWLHKAMLYVTRKFAESDSLSESFEHFLDSLQRLITHHKDLLTTVPVKILNAQLEVLLSSKSWLSGARILRYVNHMIITFKPRVLDSQKLLQLFINNEKNPLLDLPNSTNSQQRFESSLIIYSLFHLNEVASSTMPFLESVLVLYLGSQRAEDLLLKDVLQTIEKNLTQSWVNKITNWDYQDEISQEEIDLVGEERLFIKDSSSFVVALNKKFVKNTIESKSSFEQIPKVKKYEAFAEFSRQCPSGSHQDTIYDPEFLMLLIINNDELVKENEGAIHFNINKLVESDLLRFIITSLAYDKVREIAKIILSGLLKDLCDVNIPYKDKNIMKVFISSIMHTLRVADHSVSLVWYIVGSLCTIIANPGHHLYDRVHRYILSTPIIKPNAIPLFNSIILCLKNDDAIEDDDYHKPVVWIVEQMTYGVKNSADLKLLKTRDILEMILNIFNSNYASQRVRLKILAFLYSIQTIGAEGSDMLVTKFAGISALEIIKRSVSADTHAGLQEKLNVDQIALRIGFLKSQKRVREWTFDNVESAVKRIHLS